MIARVSIDASVVLAVRVLLVLVFVRALYAKGRHYDDFVGVVANYRLVPAPLTSAVAGAVLASEAFVVLSLTTGYAILSGTGLAAALLCLFGVAIGINLARGRKEIDCGCFRSDLRQLLGPELLVRNGLLAAAACVPLMGEEAAADGLQLIGGSGAGASFFVLYLLGEQLGAARRQAALIRARWS